jgi:hypothetical protein
MNTQPYNNHKTNESENQQDSGVHLNSNNEQQLTLEQQQLLETQKQLLALLNMTAEEIAKL